MVINGKVVLISGAGQGIGRGIALRRAKDSALEDVNVDKLGTVQKEVEAFGRKGDHRPGRRHRLPLNTRKGNQPCTRWF